MRPASLVTALFLCLITVGHLIRLVLRVAVTVDGIAVPLWASFVAAVFTGALAFFLWRESRTEQPAGTATPR
jgi:hypothetical protein